MEFYNDIESFIEAYLYFDASPTETQQQTKQCCKKGDLSEQDSQDFGKLIDTVFSGHLPCHSPSPLTPLYMSVFPEPTNPGPANLTNHTDSNNFDHNVNQNCTNVKTIQEFPCCQCSFKCSDLNEMRNHQLTFHVHRTAIESYFYLNHVAYGSRN